MNSSWIRTREEEKHQRIAGGDRFEIEMVELEEEEKVSLLGEIEEEQEERKVPEVEIQLYRQGRGPIAVFKSKLGGWEQDQLEVIDILDNYGLKSIYAFNTQSGRGVPIRFNPRNGRSILTYRPGAVVYVDGEPKVHTVSFFHFISAFV